MAVDSFIKPPSDLSDNTVVSRFFSAITAKLNQLVDKKNIAQLPSGASNTDILNKLNEIINTLNKL